MRIAISCDAGIVSEHFGRCEKYVIVELVGGEVRNRSDLKNPGHEPEFLPRSLKEKGVEVLITGGLGPRALKLFDSYKIRVVVTLSKKVDEVIEDFRKGELQERANPCEH